MAALDEMDVSALSSASEASYIRELIAKLFWGWYFTNTDRKLTTIKWLFFRKTVYLRDLYSVFELLFGSPNATT